VTGMSDLLDIVDLSTRAPTGASSSSSAPVRQPILESDGSLTTPTEASGTREPVRTKKLFRSKQKPRHSRSALPVDGDGLQSTSTKGKTKLKARIDLGSNVLGEAAGMQPATGSSEGMTSLREEDIDMQAKNSTKSVASIFSFVGEVVRRQSFLDGKTKTTVSDSGSATVRDETYDPAQPSSLSASSTPSPSLSPKRKLVKRVVRRSHVTKSSPARSAPAPSDPIAFAQEEIT